MWFNREEDHSKPNFFTFGASVLYQAILKLIHSQENFVRVYGQLGGVLGIAEMFKKYGHPKTKKATVG